MRLLLATRNASKLAELQRLLSGAVPGVEVVGLDAVGDVPETVETGATFAENALLKARDAARATGLPAVADDSRIEGAALGGAAGVRPARFAGEDASDEENLAKLMREVPDAGARRVADGRALAHAEPGGTEELFEATCEGTLATEPRGSGGFGYDPAFVPLDTGDGRTMAELDPREKDAVSHRGRAARSLLDWLERREEPT